MATTLITILILAAVSAANAEQIIKVDFLNRALDFVNDKTNFLKHQITDSDKPAFCNKLDCPAYKLMKKKEGYEVRKYDESHWVSTGIKGISYDSATYTLFMRLFDYISGKNARKEKIDMTCPVLIKIIPGQGPACKDDFTMSFYIAPKVADPPKPTDSNVTLTSLPAQTVYVSEYPGFTDQEKVIAHAANLTSYMQKDKVSYDKSYYFSAGYDAPFKVFNRHNEIWFIGN